MMALSGARLNGIGTCLPSWEAVLEERPDLAGSDDCRVMLKEFTNEKLFAIGGLRASGPMPVIGASCRCLLHAMSSGPGG